jgi:dihydropteroate synthase
MDPCGVFRIMVDREGSAVVALHYVSADAKEPHYAIRGKTAEEVLSEIARLKLVSQLGHAGYLGSELAKAEIALKTGKGYLQDAALF